MAYDLIIIGGGPAGYHAADFAGKANLKTLLIEKNNIGGVCLNEGCIPSKTLLYSAKLYDNARHSSKYGITAENVSYDHSTVMKRKDKVIKILAAGIKKRLKNNNVEILKGQGQIIDKKSAGFVVQGNGTSYLGKRLLLATGSEPVIPPIPGLKEGLEKNIVLTNREILNIPDLPSSLAIIGGGVIGLEMASYFNSVGSKVTIIEMLDHIGGTIDLDIAHLLQQDYQKKGITFLVNSKVININNNSLTIEGPKGQNIVKAEKILLSVGRKASTSALGIENISVTTERDFVLTDEHGRTNIPDVYAAGDINGISMLAHTAYREAEICISNILGKESMMNYQAIPAVIYTNPEVSSCGETETSAQEKKLDYESVTLSMRYSGRYVAENEGGNGICKLLFDKKNKRLLGAHMLGNYSSEIIYGQAMMIEKNMTIEDIQNLVFPHPTVSEIIKEGSLEL